MVNGLYAFQIMRFYARKHFSAQSEQPELASGIGYTPSCRHRDGLRCIHTRAGHVPHVIMFIMFLRGNFSRSTLLRTSVEQACSAFRFHFLHRATGRTSRNKSVLTMSTFCCLRVRLMFLVYL